MENQSLVDLANKVIQKSRNAEWNREKSELVGIMIRAIESFIEEGEMEASKKCLLSLEMN